MALFDFFRKKEKSEEPKKAQPLSAVSWSTWSDAIEHVPNTLAKEVAFAKSKGLRVLIFSFEPWSPGSVAFRNFGQHPLGLELLKDYHVIETKTGNMQKLVEMGFKGHSVPQIWLLERDGNYLGKTTTGALWGPDSPENIFHAMKTWLQQNS